MKQKTIFFFALLITTSVNAQLQVDYSGKVGVGNADVLTSALTVGSFPYYIYSHNIGLTSSPVFSPYSTNVGIEGVVTSSYSSSDTNHGIIGVVNPYSQTTHGRNFGVSGIYSGAGTGGAGIFGSSNFYSYLGSPSISGSYAGYFSGNVYISDELTVSTINTTSDTRLKDNIVLMEDKEGGEPQALNKVLNMKVLEYNLRTRDTLDSSDGAYAILQKEHPDLLEKLLKQRKEFTSQLHFGLSAQDLQSIYPNLVSEGQDGYLSVNYIELVPVLIRCIQELKQEVDELKASAGSIIIDSQPIADSNLSPKED